MNIRESLEALEESYMVHLSNRLPYADSVSWLQDRYVPLSMQR